jgi:ATP-dependent RNA helicase RhlE
VNFELPMVPQDYVHRIGRTGRAGTVGEAISLVCVDEAPLLRDIERLLGRPVPAEVVVGFEPDRSIRPEPIRLRSAEHRAMPSRARRPAAPPVHRPATPVAHRPASTAHRPATRRAGQAPDPSAMPARRGGSAAGTPDRFVMLPGERFARRDTPLSRPRPS